MAVDDFGIEVLKKAAEEVTPGVKSDYLIKVKDISTQKTAFGEILVANLTPLIQLQFPYNINSKLVKSDTNNAGTIVVDNDRASVSTGASSNSRAIMSSIKQVRYNPGEGGLIRFSGLFTPGADGSRQWIGIGDSSDGYFFGFRDTVFGILRRSAGSVVAQTLTITTGSSTDEDITITLDGEAVATVTVTNSGSAETTAQEISDFDFSDVGNGWDALSVGSTVIFISFDSENKTGAFSLSGATAVGGFDQTVQGVAPSEEFIAQTSWNGSNFLASPVILNPTKGNVFQIRYQWLGFGNIEFSIENPLNGSLTLVHTIKYSNSSILASVSNPTLPLSVQAINTTNASNISVKVGSIGGFIEGKKNGIGIPNSASVEKTIGTGTNEFVILSIRVKEIYQNRINRVSINIPKLTISTDQAGLSRFRIYKNPTLTGEVFTDVDADTSTVQEDTSSTAFSNGDLSATFSLGKSDSQVIDLEDFVGDLNKGDILTITNQPDKSNASNVAGASINWRDVF